MLINHGENRKLILIVGPTAIGKSNLAIYLAQKYNAEIFSADSRQIYTELNIGTAKPTLSERRQVRHHFIDIVSVQDHYSAGQYEQEIDIALQEYFKFHSLAIIVGGTGLYINAAIYGLDSFPLITDQVRAKIQKKYEEGGLIALQNEVKAMDPDYFKIVDINNPMRLMRALGVIYSSFKPYSSFIKGNRTRPKYNIIPIVLDIDRKELYHRINERVDKMIESGFLDEVKNLMKWSHLKALNSVGYSELIAHLKGEIDWPTAIELIKRNTRRYAKRQLTWINNQYPDWPRFTPNYSEISNYIDRVIG